MFIFHLIILPFVSVILFLLLRLRYYKDAVLFTAFSAIGYAIWLSHFLHRHFTITEVLEDWIEAILAFF